MACFSSYARLRRVLLFGLLSAGLVPHAAWAQVGIGTASPDPKAALDIRSTDKGLLIPRMDSAQRVAIAHPPAGLLVFQLDGRQGLWYALNGQWYYMPDQRTPDNLGNHTATQPLKLLNQPLTNNGTGGLRIDTAGQVGIGTGAPTAPLHVSGTAAENHNLAATGTFRASGTARPTVARNVSDGDLSTSWQTGPSPAASQWLEVDFGAQSRTIREYRVALPATGNPTRGWILQGSANGSAWINLHTVDSSALVVGGWGTYPLNLLLAYRYYRLFFPTVASSSLPLAVAEWELRETPDVPSSLALRVMPGALQLETGAAVRRFSTDGALSGNADDAVPTERAVRTYVGSVRADNLGNHIATRNLDLGTYQLTGNGGSSGLKINGSGNLWVPHMAGLGTRMVQVDQTGQLIPSDPVYNWPPQPLQFLGIGANLIGVGRQAVMSGTRMAVLSYDSVNTNTSTNFQLQILDVANPAQPTVVTGRPLPAYPHSIAMSGNFVYVPNAASIDVYDVSLLPITVTQSVATGVTVTELVASGNRLYMLGYGSTPVLRVFDISNPGHPQSLGMLALSAQLPVQLAADGMRVCFNDPVGGRLYFYDLTTVGAVVATSLPLVVSNNVALLGGHSTMRGTRAYFPDCAARKLHIIEMGTGGAAPQLMFTLSTTGFPLDVLATDDRMFLVSGLNLEGYDVHNLGAPQLTEQQTAYFGRRRALARNGEYLYVLNGLRVEVMRYAQPQVMSVSSDGSIHALPATSLFSLSENLVLNDREIRLRSAGSNTDGLGYYGNGQPWTAQQVVDGPVLYGNGGGVLGVRTGNNSRSVLTWKADGQVGIGTADPQRTLDVNGTIRQQTYASGSLNLTSGSRISYDWTHNLGYQPVVMVSIDQTGGFGGENVLVSYQHLSANTTRFWLKNTQTSTAVVKLRWIRVD